MQFLDRVTIHQAQIAQMFQTAADLALGPAQPLSEVADGRGSLGQFL